MKILHLVLTKEQLRRLTDDEQALFFGLSFFLTDLNILLKSADASIRASRILNSQYRWVQDHQTLTFMRFAAGTIKEGWELLRRTFFGTSISRDFNSLLEAEGREAIERLKTYFNRANNAVSVVRNRFSFHYANDEIRSRLARIPDDEMSDILLDRDGIKNSAFNLSNALTGQAMFESIDNTNLEQAMELFYREVLSTGRDCVTFSTNVLSVILIKKLGLQGEEEKIDGLPSRSGIALPFWTEEGDGAGESA